MLVLSRGLGESIIIGDNIEVKIVEMHNGKARIGVIAPDDVSIHRKEVYERIKIEGPKRK